MDGFVGISASGSTERREILARTTTFVLAPGVGLNVFFAHTVVVGMGYTWQPALTAASTPLIKGNGMSLCQCRRPSVVSAR